MKLKPAVEKSGYLWECKLSHIFMGGGKYANLLCIIKGTFSQFCRARFCHRRVRRGYQWVGIVFDHHIGVVFVK